MFLRVCSSAPPWVLNTAGITDTIAPFSKSEQPLQLATLAKEKLHNDFEGFLKVYTDGSKLDNGQVGCAFVIPELSVTKTNRLNNFVSVFSAELFAIQQALEYVEQLPQTDRIVIFSDSKSALQALRNPTSRNRVTISEKCRLTIHRMIERGASVCLCWIPSHVGILGNEMADSAAKEAAAMPDVTDSIGLSVSEAYSRLKLFCKTKWNSLFSATAQEKNWVDPDSVHSAFQVFNLPRRILPLFYRLRTAALKIDHTGQKCTCGQDINFRHIFGCVQIQSCLIKTKDMLAKSNSVFTPSILFFMLSVVIAKKE
jgi:kelch-like protein 2/3